MVQYQGESLTREDKRNFDVNLNGLARRRLKINNYFVNGNEFVIDTGETGTIFRIPNIWKSYNIKITILESTITEDEDVQYDVFGYGEQVYDANTPQKVWSDITANILTTEFVGNNPDYAYIKITLSVLATQPRIIINYQ